MLGGCLLATVLGCGTQESAPTCDLSDVAQVCEVGSGPIASVVGTVDGQTLDLTTPENWEFRYPPSWTLHLNGEEVFLSLWTGSQDFGAQPATGFFTLDRDGPIYCAMADTCAASDDGTGMARLSPLARLGNCPGSLPVEGEIEGCVGPHESAQCLISGGPLPAGGREVWGYGLWLAPGETGITADFGDGDAFDFDTRRGAGTLVYEGELYCVGDFSVNSDDPDRVEFTLTDLSRFGACEDAPAVDGSLRVCVSGL